MADTAPSSTVDFDSDVEDDVEDEDNVEDVAAGAGAAGAGAAGAGGAGAGSAGGGDGVFHVDLASLPQPISIVEETALVAALAAYKPLDLIATGALGLKRVRRKRAATLGAAKAARAPAPPLAPVPTTTRATPRTFYLDPEAGSVGGDGSAAAPWTTLAHVLATQGLIGGDTLMLARGYHGAPLCRGDFSADAPLTVRVMPGHTACVHSLAFTRASFWRLLGMFQVTGPLSTPRGHPDAGLARSGIQVDTTCKRIEFDTVAIYGTQDSSKWKPVQWTRSSARIFTDAPDTVFRNCHLYNASGGLQSGFAAANLVVEGVTIENFPTDGMGLKGASPRVDRCYLYGSYNQVVPGNHADMIQIWARNNGVISNTFIAVFVDPAQPFITKRGLSTAQVIGAFDGLKDGWKVFNCILAGNHPITFWGHGIRNTEVVFNTIVRCGPELVFKSKSVPGRDIPPRRPSIVLSGPKKVDYSRTTSVKGYGRCTVLGNIAEEINAPEATTASGPNLLLDYSKMLAACVNPRPPVFDFHPKAPAAGGRLLALPLSTPVPAYAARDYDGNPVDGSSGILCAGALQYNPDYKPFKAAARPVVSVVQTSIGVDVAWTAQPQDRCFEVLADGVRVGLQRTGASTWLVVGGKAEGVTYTVRTVANVCV
jgi:hypothetical protein